MNLCLLIYLLIYLSLPSICLSKYCDCSADSKREISSSVFVDDEVQPSCPHPPHTFYLTGSATSYPEITGVATKSLTICFCPCLASGGPTCDEEYTYKWLFHASAPIDEARISTFASPGERNAIFSKFLFTGDEGDHSCLIEGKKGKTNNEFRLRVLMSDPTCKSPKQPVVKPVKNYAILGQKTIWSCEAFVGEKWLWSNVSLTFYHQTKDGVFKEVISSSEASVMTNHANNGILSGNLTIHKVLRRHFGNYLCRISNYDQPVEVSFSLVEGVAEPRLTMETLKVLLISLCTVVAMGFFIVFFYLTCRVRLGLVFSGNANYASNEHGAEYAYDVFLIYGADMESWIAYQLLVLLESIVGYKCFAPSRDLRGGEAIAEEVLDHLTKCRSVLIIVTSSLFESEWSQIAVQGAIFAALHKISVPVCVLIEKIDNIYTRTSKDIRLLNHLKLMRTIQHPFKNPHKGKLLDDELKRLSKIYKQVSSYRNHYQHFLQSSPQGIDLKSVQTSPQHFPSEDKPHFSASNMEMKSFLATAPGNQESKEQRSLPLRQSHARIQFWKLLRLQLHLLTSGTLEELFWCRVFLSLPNVTRRDFKQFEV